MRKKCFVERVDIMLSFTDVLCYVGPLVLRGVKI